MASANRSRCGSKSKEGFWDQWGASAYSDSNTNLLFGLGEITDQTGAGWVEIPITLYQAHFTDTALQPSPQTPTPQSVAAGIGAAHAHGFHVFVVPFLTVGASGWAGDIGRAAASLHAGWVVRTATWRAAWFDGYWQALAPYLEAAATAGAALDPAQLADDTIDLRRLIQHAP